MPRQSRTQSRASTRQHLLNTARTMLLSHGYTATSLDAIADEAGYSKGAVYSNFTNKDELCREVLHNIRADHAQALISEVSTAPTLDDMLNTFSAWCERTIGDLEWSALEAEFTVRARQNPHLRTQLARDASHIRSLIKGIIATARDKYGLTLDLSADDLATAFLSLGIGLGLQRAVDPTVRATILTDFVRAHIARSI
ncbi:TetR/AcrR family transcriptional regulator [Hoyosella rhizosphaerae]|uniref:TetR family transcriptional regulator n=1 Tax=Hoyosella rhizosphaerae TaxID=1755582 RepID=A0A916UBT0_9ACTN|nr:TetR/AcrR family transcriptional regulator [Hoyosella rhizosphaerae]MBN4925939.1 TetR/AcrR family transcriptional regulator [Hoyosella rhizosphaerae]GGC66792.1 TetR family transcriptional regulator [Hoyosella rhizosphaerae]